MAGRRAPPPLLGMSPWDHTERSIADPNVVERAALYLISAELLERAPRRARRRPT